jgi:hypothetical protein
MKTNPLITLSLVLLSLTISAFTNSQQPEDTETNLTDLIQKNNIRTLEDLVPLLPTEMRSNFALKHGIKRSGERGHLIEAKVSQSADPDLPRAILWNERNGFTVSYNGGATNQLANQRLDILSFSEKDKIFSLTAINFPLSEEQIINGHSKIVVQDQSCKECHGSMNRPILSMYPDWPAFYGSDNDELNNPNSAVQKLENTDYQNFLRSAGSQSPRYAPLFDSSLVEQNYGLKIWPTYPYRQDTSEVASHISRSFSFRPLLRLGIIYNRQTAKVIFHKMKQQSNYPKWGLFTLHSLLQCNWNPDFPKTKALIKSEMQKDLKETPRWVMSENLQLDYYQLWKIYNLKINDVDIRYSYNHAGYANTNASKKIMEPGYINRYFNSYFDGTATIDELIAGELLDDLSNQYPELASKYRLRGLTEKYQRFVDRFHYDKEIFSNFDRLGKWFPIPYDPVVFKPHHRETYDTEMIQEHKDICNLTAEILKNKFKNGLK